MRKREKERVLKNLLQDFDGVFYVSEICHWYFYFDVKFENIMINGWSHYYQSDECSTDIDIELAKKISEYIFNNLVSCRVLIFSYVDYDVAIEKNDNRITLRYFGTEERPIKILLEEYPCETIGISRADYKSIKTDLHYILALHNLEKEEFEINKLKLLIDKKLNMITERKKDVQTAIPF